MLYPVENRYRQRRALDGIWGFRMDRDEVGQSEGWHDGPPGCRLLAVPASWNDQTQDEELRTHLGSGWYERRFWAQPMPHDQRIWLRFGAVNYRADVWLNGVQLGSHEGGFTPFEFDVTDALNFESDNRLVVRVDCRLTADTVPMGHFPLELGSTNYYGQFPLTAGDFFPYAGIHRPVVLYTRPASCIEDLTVTTGLTGSTGQVRCRVQTATAVDLVQVQIRDESGEVVAMERARVQDGNAMAEVSIEHVKVWGPGHPYLYTLDVTAVHDGRTVDQYQLPVGVRTIEVTRDALLINGKPVFLKGFGRHEDFHLIGRGMSHAVIVKDYALMSWCHANSFRTTHYPYAEEQMQMADRLGFLVIDEVPAVSLAIRATSEATLASHKRQLDEMVARDKNHPCVIAWSVANEADTWLPDAEPYFAEVASHIRSLDTSRPNMIVLYVDPDREQVAHHFDLIGINRYLGWYQHPGQLTEASTELSRQLDRLYERYERPIMMCEFGADAVHGLHSDPPEMYTEEYQARLFEAYHNVISEKKFMFGEHVWNLTDFKTQQHIRRVFYNHKGVFTRDRQPKMAAHAIRRVWSDTPNPGE